MEIKSAPYEILLRFSHEKGEKFGYLRGMHAVMEQYAVDDEGNIIGRIETGAVARPFTAEELEQFFGTPFVIFKEQVEAERLHTEAAFEDAGRSAGMLAKKSKEYDDLLDRFLVLSTKHEELKTSASAMAEAAEARVNELEGELRKLEGELHKLQDEESEH